MQMAAIIVAKEYYPLTSRTPSAHLPRRNQDVTTDRADPKFPDWVLA